MRLFLAVALPSALLVAGLGVAAWWGARAAVLQSQQRELKSAARMGASTLSAGTARHLLPGDEQSRTYARLLRKLRSIKNATGAVRVVLLDPDRAVLADADGALSIGAPAPRVALDRAEFERAQTNGAQVSVPFSDAAGTRYLSAYSPVRERDLGLGLPPDSAPPLILALQAPASLLDVTDQVARYLVLVVLFVIGLVFLLAGVVARTITSPLRSLAQGAERLGQGGLESAVLIPPGDDEVTALARTLETMRVALLQRDNERQMMLAGIAHEVRNPLGGMELFSGLLQETIEEVVALDAETRAEMLEHIGRVRTELRYLTGVVNDFLAFARDLPLERIPVDVAKLLAEVSSLGASKGGPQIELDCQAQAPFAMDRGRVKEALLNLVRNACEATPPEGRVTLRAARHDEELWIDVVDTGKGMAPEVVENVFRPFFTTREKGSGLGLPLVRKFARDHGGDAVLTSTLGQGTTLSLRLSPGRVRQTLSGIDSEPALLGDSEFLGEAEAGAGADERASEALLGGARSNPEI